MSIREITMPRPVFARGFVSLLSVLVAGAVGTALVTILLLQGIGATKTGLALHQSYQAKALATACTETALQRINTNPAFEGSGSLSPGQGSCSYTVTRQAGQERTITSTGTVGSIVRKERVTLSQLTPALQVSSWQEVADI